MFSSLKTKIIFFIALILVATAAGVMYFTHRDVGNAMSRAEEASAKNVLRLVELNILGGYKKLLTDRVESMAHRKRGLKSQAGVALSVSEQFATLARKRLVSKKFAQQSWLDWLRSLSSVEEQLLFVFDNKGVIIAHPDPSLQSVSIATIHDMKGRSIAKSMTASVLAPDGDFALFDWDKPEEEAGRKKLGYFVPVQEWKWTIAAVVDISDIEAEAQRKIEEIIKVLEETFAKIQVAESGSVFMFNGEREMLIPPRAQEELDYRSTNNASTGNLLLDDLMVAAESGDNSMSFVVSVGGSNRVMEAYVRHFKALDWYIAVAVPVEEIQLPAKTLVTRQIFIMSLIFLGSLIVAYLLVTRISHPLNLLASYARELPTSDFTSEEEESSPIDNLSAKYKDEVGRLAESFLFMRAELRKNVRKLMETTAAKERIESELQIAHDIQMGIIPKLFPPFPQRDEFELYAILKPAKEVGGDFYDFFFIDNHHLCFVVGDVSGKGVPASLFMAVSKTLIKMEATRAIPPEELMNRVNRNLSMDNPSLMFVTLFFGMLNVHTGELEYCLGGHDPPYIIRSSGDIERLPLTGGVVLGVDEDFHYESRKTVIHKGETIFLYTDGVTEAMNPEDQLFTDQRLEKALARWKEKDAMTIINSVRQTVRNFSEGTPQSDDITMLALKFYG
ncbi:MAG: SpoIIE family protein phosphatase [Deltaproteobacteria bacterium]|nr:MAG: SpoIIE family protein phosphatase [Deltaproteobacteria bacterium]